VSTRASFQVELVACRNAVANKDICSSWCHTSEPIVLYICSRFSRGHQLVPVFRGNPHWTTANGISVIFDGANGHRGGNFLICFASQAAFTVFLPLTRFRMVNCCEISQSSSVGSIVYTRIFLATSGNWRGRDPRIAQLGTIAQPGEPQYKAV
jgi:hypothetical protein